MDSLSRPRSASSLSTSSVRDAGKTTGNQLAHAWLGFVDAAHGTFVSYAHKQSSKWRAQRSVLRNILLCLMPFLAYLVVFKNYNVIRAVTGLEGWSDVHLGVLPRAERFMFGCLPHRILGAHHNMFLDILAAIPYLVHFPLPLLFVVYLRLAQGRGRDVFFFLWLAGWVNFIAVLVQLCYPTAPPWFEDTAVFDTEGGLIYSTENEAGFARLDAAFGMPMFHNLYAQSPVKFGAFPSLHVAWPAMLLVCNPWGGYAVGMAHVAWIFWAALYANHHYGVDAIGGIVLVLIVFYSMLYIWSPFRPSRVLLGNWHDRRFSEGYDEDGSDESEEAGSPLPTVYTPDFDADNEQGRVRAGSYQRRREKTRLGVVTDFLMAQLKKLRASLHDSSGIFVV